jgi:hypothetical protein
MKPTAEAKSAAGRKAQVTMHSAVWRAHRSEKASKEALLFWCSKHRWKVIFFEGASGAPRTGIVDAVIARIRPPEVGPRDADGIDIRLVQLKSGKGGLTGREITRIEQSVKRMSKDWVLAAFDGQTLHFLPELPSGK